MLAAIGLLLLALGVLGRATPMATPEGRLCPTARPATIRVAVLSPCGCVIGHVERAPRPGEKGFLQCRCGEKRAAQESHAPPAPALPAAAFRLDLPIVPVAHAEHRVTLGRSAWSASPGFRPPATA